MTILKECWFWSRGIWKGSFSHRSSLGTNKHASCGLGRPLEAELSG